MFTSHDGRGRQIARNLTIAVASAALAGSAAAMAADTGGTPPPSKQSTKRVAHIADCAKPDPGAKGDRAPLSPDDPIVGDVRTRLQDLVAADKIEQGEADAVLREVTAGSVNLDALVNPGTITAAHAETIDAVLKEIKNGHAGEKAESEKPPAAATAKRAKAARGI